MKRDTFREPYSDTPSTYPTSAMKELFEAILSLKTKEEAANFFRDLLTMAEIKEFTNRWQMVKMLVSGKSYVDVAETLNVSTATVTRVAHWLHHGMGGYKAVADGLFETTFKDSVKPKKLHLRGKRYF